MRFRSTVSTLSIMMLCCVAPSAVLAGKDGVPNANGVSNGQGAGHAHQNGAEDPNSTRGNDSAPEENGDVNNEGGTGGVIGG